VGLHGGLGDDRGAPDPGVGTAAGNLDENVALSLGESAEGTRRLGRLGVAPELLDHSPGHCRVEQCITGGDGADRTDQRLGRRALQQEAARAGAESLVHVVVDVERGQQHGDVLDMLEQQSETSPSLYAVRASPGGSFLTRGQSKGGLPVSNRQVGVCSAVGAVAVVLAQDCLGRESLMDDVCCDVTELQVVGACVST
jgi:hypothetical protein